MEKAIKNRIPIHIDLQPNRDEVYSGICLKDNKGKQVPIPILPKYFYQFNIAI